MSVSKSLLGILISLLLGAIFLFAGSFNSILIDGVNVTVDEQVRDLPFKTVQYYGKFDITAIENGEKTIVIDGEDVIKKIKLYTLNKLTYTDSNKDLKDSE